MRRRNRAVGRASARHLAPEGRAEARPTTPDTASAPERPPRGSSSTPGLSLRSPGSPASVRLPNPESGASQTQPRRGGGSGGRRTCPAAPVTTAPSRGPCHDPKVVARRSGDVSGAPDTRRTRVGHAPDTRRTRAGHARTRADARGHARTRAGRVLGHRGGAWRRADARGVGGRPPPGSRSRTSVPGSCGPADRSSRRSSPPRTAVRRTAATAPRVFGRLLTSRRCRRSVPAC